MPHLQVTIVRVTGLALKDADDEKMVWCRLRTRQTFQSHPHSDLRTPHKYLADRPATDESFFVPQIGGAEWNDTFDLPIQDPSNAQLHILVLAGENDRTKELVGEVILDVSQLVPYYDKRVEHECDVIASAEGISQKGDKTQYDVGVGKLQVQLCLQEGSMGVGQISEFEDVSSTLQAKRNQLQTKLKPAAGASADNSCHSYTNIEVPTVKFKSADVTGVSANAETIGATPCYSTLIFVDRITFTLSRSQTLGQTFLDFRMRDETVVKSRMNESGATAWTEEVMIPGVTGLPHNHQHLITLHLMHMPSSLFSRTPTSFASCSLPLVKMLSSKEREATVDLTLKDTEGTVKATGTCRLRCDEPVRTLFSLTIAPMEEDTQIGYVCDQTGKKLMETRKLTSDKKALLAKDSKSNPQDTSITGGNTDNPVGGFVSQVVEGDSIEIRDMSGELVGRVQTDVTIEAHARTRVYDRDGTHWTTVKAVATSSTDHGRGVAFKMVETWGDLSIQVIRDMLDENGLRASTGNVIQVTRHLKSPQDGILRQGGPVELVGRIVLGGEEGTVISVPPGKAILLVTALAIGVSEARRHRPTRKLGTPLREKPTQKKWKLSYGH